MEGGARPLAGYPRRMPAAPTLVLASASPARLKTLREVGFDPEVMVSDVDEDALLAATRAAGELTFPEAVELLARAKGEDVASRAARPTEALVLACDSMLEIGGELVGKPHDADVARQRWRAMRGGTGVLHTGHWLVNLRDGAATGGTSSTIVHFADASDAEIDAYIATGEPLKVAGAFTIDGRGAAFIDRIEGDHHGVVGVSIPLVRRMLADLGIAVSDLWVARSASA